MQGSQIAQKSEALRMKILYRQSRASQLVGLTNFVVYIFFCIEIFGQQSFLELLGVGVSVSLGRFLIQERFRQVSVGNFDSRLWENLFSGGAAVMGLVWGTAGCWLPANAIVEQAFLAFVLAGTTAGATVAYCTSYRTVIAFLFSSVTPFAVNMLTGGGRLQLAMGLMLFLYVAALATLMRHLHGFVLDSIRLRFEKDQALTDLEAARNSFAHSTKMAALGEMAGGIAHEINNPLAIIRANSGLMRRLLQIDPINREKLTDLASRIDHTVDRIAKIVAGLRTFSREAGNDPLEDVSAREMIEQTIEFCDARFRGRGIPLEIDLPEGDLLVTCRRVQISQVLLNLLNNAFDAVKDLPEPWVRVRASMEGNGVAISVCDAGRGISQEIRDKIMQPFFTTKKVGEGTGLGLSIAHGIMEGHGGTLLLDEQSPNTRFVMQFSPRPPALAEAVVA